MLESMLCWFPAKFAYFDTPEGVPNYFLFFSSSKKYKGSARGMFILQDPTFYTEVYCGAWL